MNLFFCINTFKRILIYFPNHFLFAWNNYICHSQARFLRFKEFTTETSIFLNNNIKIHYNNKIHLF